MKLILLAAIVLFTTSSIAQDSTIHSAVYHFSSLPVRKDSLRVGRKLLQGKTKALDFFEIHCSTQMPGAVARPPHALGDKEELIIITEGKLKGMVGDTTAILGPGSLMLIPPLVSQQFFNIGNTNLTYYVMQFRSKKPMYLQRSNTAGGALLLNRDSLPVTKGNNKTGRKYFDRASAMFGHIEVHTTSLQLKGPSHNPHQHEDMELILVTEGETQMTIDGKEYTGNAGDLYVVESNVMHVIANASDKPCSYFAIRFQ